MSILDFFKRKPAIKSGEKRKQQTHAKLRAKGIAYTSTLPTLETAEEVQIKDLPTVCKRAVAALLVIQAACEIATETADEETTAFYTDLLEKFGVKSELNSTERRLMFTSDYTKQDAINVTWTYEAYWALLWALGLVDDISDASSECDCEKAVCLVAECESFEEFMNQCHLRSTEDILDMLDLYYRYHWACVEKQIRPNTSIGNLNVGVVCERRRGLEWLISEEEDWFEVAMDT